MTLLDPTTPYDLDDECRGCGAHISDPHDPGCPAGDLADAGHDPDETYSELDVEAILRDLLSGDDEAFEAVTSQAVAVRTFAAEGVMTANQGVVLTTADGRQFQIQIMRSN